MAEPAWKARKAALDAMDDGHGPYCSWAFDAADVQERKSQLWQDFVAWARLHLGQGYSLACAEGSPLDEVTLWAFKAYMAGREGEQEGTVSS